MTARNKKTLIFVSAVFALLIALSTLVSQYFLFKDYTQKKTWPIIEARVIKTRIVGKRAVLPEITYQYQVKGKTYSGKSDLQTPPFGARNKRTLTAQTILKEHPVGSYLKIAYNPQNPQQSTTGFHLPWNFYMKVSFALSLILLTFYLMMLYFKKSE